MNSKKFCVIGLGYFGLNLALNLSEEGAEVIAIDKDSNRVELLADKVALAVQLDTTDAKALQSMGIKDMDAVVLAIGESFEASINTLAVLQEIGVKRILVRIVSPIHERLVKLMNINELLYPEAEAAKHLSNRLLIPGLIESFEISKEFGIFEINVPAKFHNKSLLETKLRSNYKINLVTVKRMNSKKGMFSSEISEKIEVMGVITPDYVFKDNDILVLFGKEVDFRKMLDEVV
jgi:trk system potassium uptake protein TrkA